MVYYAQLNKDKICIGVSQLSGKVGDPFLIEIEPTDYPMGKKYEKDQWIEIEEEIRETNNPEPTNTDFRIGVASMRISEESINWALNFGGQTGITLYDMLKSEGTIVEEIKSIQSYSELIKNEELLKYVLDSSMIMGILAESLVFMNELCTVDSNIKLLGTSNKAMNILINSSHCKHLKSGYNNENTTTVKGKFLPLKSEGSSAKVKSNTTETLIGNMGEWLIENSIVANEISVNTIDEKVSEAWYYDLG